MIDYLALALGHGLLALAMLRLVMRDTLDIDPAVQELLDEADRRREATTVAGRAAQRRSKTRHSSGQRDEEGEP